VSLTSSVGEAFDALNRTRRPALKSILVRNASASAARAVRVFLLVAVLSYSDRLFVKAFLNERRDDWRHDYNHVRPRRPCRTPVTQPTESHSGGHERAIG
jgi:hypothetical protein